MGASGELRADATAVVSHDQLLISTASLDPDVGAVAVIGRQPSWWTDGILEAWLCGMLTD